MPALVGREVELARLCALLDGAVARLSGGRGGAGQPVLLGGPAGIGTSRVAAELMALARARGVIALHARPSGPALAPVLDALRGHLDSLPGATRTQLLAGTSGLGGVLGEPIVIRRVPTEVPVHGAGPDGAGPPDGPVEQLRVAEEVVRLLARLADRAAVLLVVDDAHRADAGTIAVARHLAARLAARPVLVVLAHRTPGLDALAVEVRRHDPAAEVTLGPLPDAAMREIVGVAATDELLRRAAGVPLFALALAADSGLPPVVRDVARVVLGALDPTGRALFELVAVAGSATADVLDRAVPGSRAALRGLVACGLVTEDAEPAVPRFRVAHPLHSEVAVAELLADERRRLHAALAVALDAGGQPGDDPGSAQHHLGARGYVDPVRAGEVLRSAGLAAAAERADVDAERYLRAAAALGGIDGTTDAEILAALGRVSERLGRPADAVAAWTRAIPLAAGDDVQSDALRVAIGSLEFEHGTAGSPGVDRSAEHAVVALLQAARFGDAARIRVAAERLTAFESAEGDAARAAAALGRTNLAVLRGDLVGARGHAEASVEHGRRCPGALFAGIAERELARVALLVGDLAAARNHAQRNLDAGLAAGPPRVECSGRVNMAMLHHLSGHMADALREAELGLVAGRLAGTPRSLARALLANALLAADQGRARAAREQLTEAERVLPGGGGEAGAVALAEMTRVLLALGVDRPLHVPPVSDWSYDSDPTIMCVRPFLAGRAQLATGDHDGAAVSLGRLRGSGRGSPLLAAFADRLEGLSQRCDAGTDLLESAADALERMGVRLHAAQARLEWAERAAERARPQARDAAVAAVAVFDTAGITGWSDRGRRLARAMGLRTPPRRAATGPLTARESEVAGLVADGLSNADIAAALFLGERTVESHMAKIYRRLGLTSRVELAAWAARVRAGTDGPAEPGVR